MTILRERVVWSRPRRASRAVRLAAEEQSHVRAALRALRCRVGSCAKLARALGTSRTTITHALGQRTVTPGLALLVARLAGTTIDDVLTGRWPPPGMCPHCGRGPTSLDGAADHGHNGE